MNIYDIARLAGVSIATVSRVVNGSEKVSEKTRKKVLSIIEQEGFTPNVFAQGLGLHTMHIVGILVPDISDLYMSVAVSCLEKQLKAHGYDCILSCSGFTQEQKESHVQMLLSKHIDALILVGSTYSGHGSRKETAFIRAAAAQVPVFLINALVDGDGIYCSVSRDREAIRSVTAALIANRHRRILFLTDSKSYSASEKKKGYEEALQAAELPILSALEWNVPNDIDEVCSRLLANFPNIDSIVATHDLLAVGALKYAAAKGIAVPGELAIVGFNDSLLARCTEPALSSIDNQIEQLCLNTVDHLIAVLGGRQDVPHSFSVECRLAERRTTDFGISCV
jgi:LacI family transcriptional regulator